MKKNLFILLLMGVSTSVFATPQVGANLQLVALTSGATDNLLLLEDDAYALSDVDYSGTKIINTANPTSVNIYVSDPTLGILAQLGTKSLQNTPITVKTNQTETQYKIKVLGLNPANTRVIKLYDKQENIYTELSAANVEYEFTAAANSTIEGRFFIDYSAMTLNGLGTFVNSHNVTNVTGGTFYRIYTATTGATAKVTFTSIDQTTLAAGTPVLFMADNEDGMTVYLGTEDFASSDGTIVSNGFVGLLETVAGPMNINVGEKEAALINGSGRLVFANSPTFQLAPGHAYINLAAAAALPASAPGRRTLVIGRNGITTAMESVETGNEASQKVIENGLLYIIRDGVKYNLMGSVVK